MERVGAAGLLGNVKVYGNFVGEIRLAIGGETTLP